MGIFSFDEYHEWRYLHDDYGMLSGEYGVTHLISCDIVKFLKFKKSGGPLCESLCFDLKIVNQATFLHRVTRPVAYD